MPGMPRLSAVRILITDDASLIIEALDRNMVAEVVFVVVAISICTGESQVMVV